MTEIFVTTLTTLVKSHGLLAIFVLMTAESALIPIPSEVTMPFAGFLAGRNIINFWSAVFFGALGNLIGSLIAYWLGYTKGEEWTRLAIKKWGKWLLIKQHEFDVAKKWFHRYGQAASFFSRLLPIVRTFISLPAGIAKVNVCLFATLTFIGSFAWSLVLASFGLKLGENWLAIEPYFRKFQFVIIALAVGAVFLYIRSHIKRRN